MSQKIRICMFLLIAMITAALLFYMVFTEHLAEEDIYFSLLEKEIPEEIQQQELVDKQHISNHLEQKEESSEKQETKENIEQSSFEPLEDTTSAKKICVFVCGKVKKAGIYELLEGARLSDFISAAGGFSKQAEKEYLNLAERAEDGQKIYVPSKKEVKKWKKKSEDSNSIQNQEGLDLTISKNEKVNINTAGKEELMTLSGIGEAKADAIITYREEKGAFHTIEELMQIPGIKEGIYNKLYNDITI